MQPSRTKSIRLYRMLSARKNARFNKKLFVENGLVFMVSSYAFRYRKDTNILDERKAFFLLFSKL